MPLNGKYLIPLGLLIALQVLDLIVHVATLQIEPVRITSNLIILAGAIASVLIDRPRSRAVIHLAAGAYLLLNLLFLAQHGVVNPTTEALRIPLFAFVLASLATSFWLGRRFGQ